MSGAKRECATCKFFEKAPFKGQGWCTHPKKLDGSEVKLLHRGKELACRDDWGGDLWQQGELHATTSTRSSYRGLTIRSAQPDDEVSSVTDTGLVATSSSATDDIVKHTAVRRLDNDRNDDAIADQAERAMVMRSGPGFALKEAQRRMVNRRTTPRPMIEPDPPVASDAVPEVAATAQPRIEPVVRREVNPANLRKFFGTGDSGQDQNDLGPVTNSYEKVWDEATKIRVGQRPNLYGQPARAPEPTISSPQEQERATTFERVHQVIAQTTTPAEPAVTNVAPAPPVEPELDALPEIDLESTTQEVEAYQYEPDIPFADDYADFEPLDAADDEIAVAPRPTESPRGSWWRSLNFGRKRRYQPEAETWQDDPVAAVPSRYFEDEAAEEPWDEADEALAAEWDDSYEDEELLVAESGEWSAAEPDYEDTWDDEPYQDDLDYAASNEEEDAYAITSEESWLEDAHFFPAAQPPSWHEERSRILAARHEAASLPEPIRFEQDDSTDRLDTPLDDVIVSPVPVQRKRPQYFEIDDPAGLEQFRSALFASNRPAFTLDHEPMELSQEAPIASRQPEYRYEPQPESRRPAPAYRNDEQPRPIRQQPESRRPVPEREVDAPRADVRPAPARDVEAPQSRHRPAPARFSNPRDMFDQSFDIRNLVDDADPPRSYAVSAQVSKSCATCRSFQAIGTNGEGRCMNDWSRTHRQIVHADELACRSSIGDWWLADDTSWIPPVDRLSPETPRTNRLLARTERTPRDEISAESGVRTRKVV